MQIINVIETINGVISQIQSFTIEGDNEEEKQFVVEQAEKCFIDIVKEHEPDLEEEDEENYISDGYDDQNGYEVQIIWSHNIVQQELTEQPKENNVSYFLFGADACMNLEEDDNIEDVLKADTFAIHEFNTKDSISSFLHAYDGWGNQVELTKEQYDFLLKRQEA